MRLGAVGDALGTHRPRTRDFGPVVSLVRWTSVDPGALHRLTRRLYVTPVLYAAAAAVSLLNHWLGLGLYALVAGGYLLYTGTRALPPEPVDPDGTPAGLEV